MGVWGWVGLAGGVVLALVAVAVPFRAAILKWWRDNAPIVGTGAQWVSAFGALATMGVAIYGISEAMPLFQNRLLAERNAELELEVRKNTATRDALAASSKVLEAQIAEMGRKLEEMTAEARTATFSFVCAKLRSELDARYRTARTYNSMLFRDVMEAAKAAKSLRLIGEEDAERIRARFTTLTSTGLNTERAKLFSGEPSERRIFYMTLRNELPDIEEECRNARLDQKAP